VDGSLNVNEYVTLVAPGWPEDIVSDRSVIWAALTSLGTSTGIRATAVISAAASSKGTLYRCLTKRKLLFFVINCFYFWMLLISIYNISVEL
jgi:hypothetical protein